eukprot:COSAG05_NODE_15912_length_358_cov_0.783784_1_plen_42_part_10
MLGLQGLELFLQPEQTHWLALFQLAPGSHSWRGCTTAYYMAA